MAIQGAFIWAQGLLFNGDEQPAGLVADAETGCTMVSLRNGLGGGPPSAGED